MAGSSEMKGLPSNVSQRVVLEAVVPQLNAAHEIKNGPRSHIQSCHGTVNETVAGIVIA